jgi:hypothetical protein
LFGFQGLVDFVNYAMGLVDGGVTAAESELMIWLSLDKPLHVIYKVNKLAYRI